MLFLHFSAQFICFDFKSCIFQEACWLYGLIYSLYVFRWFSGENLVQTDSKAWKHGYAGASHYSLFFLVIKQYCLSDDYWAYYRCHRPQLTTITLFWKLLQWPFLIYWWLLHSYYILTRLTSWKSRVHKINACLIIGLWRWHPVPCKSIYITWDLSHFLTLQLKPQCILLGVYVIHPHKIVHNCKVECNHTYFKTLFSETSK